MAYGTACERKLNENRKTPGLGNLKKCLKPFSVEPFFDALWINCSKQGKDLQRQKSVNVGVIVVDVVTDVKEKRHRHNVPVDAKDGGAIERDVKAVDDDVIGQLRRVDGRQLHGATQPSQEQLDDAGHRHDASGS